MNSHTCRLLVVALGILVSATACVTPDSPTVTSALQMVSAGHTGCLPEENQISNVKMNLDGSGTWNATCKGKAYLCSAFLGVSKSESYSCAPVAQ
jgi:hypothetical protein